MGKLFNSINKGFSRIFRVLLFVLSAFLIIYFFPKSGKFKYNFENGRPWQSENLYAPFDFAIKKSQEEIDNEITQAKINTPLFFEIDTSLITNSNNLLITRIDELKNDSLFGLLKGEDVKNIKISANSDKLNINQQISLKDMSFENIGNTKDSKDYKTVLKDTFEKAFKSVKNKVLSGNVGNTLDKIKSIDEEKIKEKIKKELYENKDKVKDKLKKLLKKD